MVLSHKRGWAIEYCNGAWIYQDTKEPIDKERPCKKCGRMPTSEGYDACIGYIKNARSVCCGHGVHKFIYQI